MSAVVKKTQAKFPVADFFAVPRRHSLTKTSKSSIAMQECGKLSKKGGACFQTKLQRQILDRVKKTQKQFVTLKQNRECRSLKK